MFFHQYKYRIKYFLKTPVILFWALIFPMLLGTFFQMTFGTTFSRSEKFAIIPVAIVGEDGAKDTEAMAAIMKELKYDEGQAMFDVSQTTLTEAQQLLTDKEILGYITVGETKELTVADTGLSQSVLKQFLDQYMQSEAFITDIMQNHPESLMKAVASMQNNMEFVHKITLGGEDTNGSIQYFYALIAMVCMFGCYSGAFNAKDIQANQSTVAARRSITPTRKMVLICADTLAALTLHFIELVLVYLYLHYILGVAIGSQPALYFATCFLGSLIGISLGTFIYACVKGKENAKQATLTTVSLFLSFCSGLMDATMKDRIEKIAPFFNRINPAALITDAFYSLTVFDDYSRYIRSMITLAIISLLLLTGSVLLLRRERYESI